MGDKERMGFHIRWLTRLQRLMKMENWNLKWKLCSKLKAESHARLNWQSLDLLTINFELIN